jgi:hypothetical protein
MKKNLLLLVFPLLIGAGCNSSVNLSNLKYCQTDNDCTIKYNIKYEGNCSAGCFNKDAKSDNSCNLVWESFAPNKTCTCNDNLCS